VVVTGCTVTSQSYAYIVFLGEGGLRHYSVCGREKRGHRPNDNHASGFRVCVPSLAGSSRTLCCGYRCGITTDFVPWASWWGFHGPAESGWLRRLSDVAPYGKKGRLWAYLVPMSWPTAVGGLRLSRGGCSQLREG